MMSGIREVLLAAKPPETDVLSYLTLIEYNVNRNNVSVLEDILRDDHDLTASIGWDLVAILLPLLPQSQTCLDLVARLGNPREVILKVQEALYNKTTQEEQDDDEIDVETLNDDISPKNNPGGDEDNDDYDFVDRDEFIPATDAGSNTKFPSLDERSIITLLDMLTVLHNRIKTTYPSKFLTTSADAILSAFAHMNPGPDNECMRALLKFVLSLSAKQRPVLPSREARSSLPNQMRRLSISDAPDPEAQEIENAVEENNRVKNALENLLLRSASIYLRGLPPRHGDSHFAWTTRFNLDDERRYLPLPTHVELHGYKDADDIVQQIFVSLPRLSQTFYETDIIHTILEKDIRSEWTKRQIFEVGTSTYKSQDLLLISAKIFAYRNNLGNVPFKLPTMHEHAQICHYYLNDSSSLMIVDAIALLGYSQIDHFSYQESLEEEKWFLQYMQDLTLITLNTSQPRLRAQLAQYAKAVFDLQPSSSARFTHLMDCFQHCPFDNIKVETLSWLKDSVLYGMNLKSKLRCARLKVAEDNDLFKQPEKLEEILKVISSLYTDLDSATMVSEVPPPSTTFTLTFTNLLYFLVTKVEISVPLHVLEAIEFLDIIDKITTFQSQLQEPEASILQNSLHLLVDAVFDAAAKREARILVEMEERARQQAVKESKERRERELAEKKTQTSPRKRSHDEQ